MLHTTEPHFIFISRGPWAATVPHSPALHAGFLAAELMPEVGKQLFVTNGKTLDLNWFDLQKNIEENTISLQLLCGYEDKLEKSKFAVEYEVEK